MSKIDDGGAAFSSPEIPGYMAGERGMTLRDWFAGQALAGILASGTYSNSGEGFEDFIAGISINIADAMLRVRAALKQEGER